MCGIAGFVGRGEAADLARMTAALVHRIVDLETGDQPMATADGELVVVFNGEIYNHAELRSELEARGHRFRSDHADTEVLLHGHREWGDALVERLDGMWAFALYDRTRRRLLLCRDRFGKKPLYWTRQGDTFAFASELSAVTRHAAVERRLSPTALRKYFAHGYVPAPHSMLRGIQKLPAGSCLVVAGRGGAPRTRRWWEFRLDPVEPAPPQAEALWSEELRDRLDRAVARRLVADVPVGIFLSGGIDSSAIAALAARHAKPGELRTFTIGFEDASFDESAAARRVAEWLGASHRAALFRPDRAREVLADVAARLDEPLADASLLPTSLLCGLARRDVTVALGGDGGDELFAGYDPFRALQLADLYARLVPKPVHRAVRLLAARLPVSHANMSLDFRIKRTLAGLSHPRRLWNPVWMAPLAPEEIGALLGEPVDPEELFSEAIEAWDASGGTLVDRTLQFFTRTYLAGDILAKVDRASMMHSLEVRAPYLDLGVVELVRRVPARFKLRRGRGKFLLRSALAPVLPREVLRRPKKGFGIPVGRWLAEGTPPFDEVRCRVGGDFFAARLAEHRAGRADHRLYLFAHWMLERFLDRERLS
jgi:asparagine synthase (glutamine-hydrolysing)